MLLLTGLTIGQGVHTLADNFEKAFLWLVRRIRNSANLLATSVDTDLSAKSLKSTTDPTNPPKRHRRVLNNWWDGSIEWLRRRYWGSYDSLIGHRYLFARSIEWNYSQERGDDRWNTESRGELFDHFIDGYKDAFGHDLRKHVHSTQDIVNRYPLITAKLKQSNGSGYQNFQATYSFCRSMWVVFLLLFVVYFDLMFLGCYGGIINACVTIGQPVVLSAVSEKLYPLLLGLIGSGVVVFFDAAGTYKRHYVEYLIAEFGVTYLDGHEANDGDGDEESQENKADPGKTISSPLRGVQ
ncbi:hypothetical protein [Halobaculum sp. P14]|uniref:hypothetical protein n=1 Tax=Halobaculum sp. P14 TaxID=3421638 RepID=UPI003EB998D0